MTRSVTPTKIDQFPEAIQSALESARRYANKSRSDSTWRAYESDIRVFQTWCTDSGVQSLPAETDTVAAFIAVEADKGMAVSTIRRRLSAIRLMHFANDLPSPHESIRVADVLKGIANDQKSRVPDQAKPALDADIRKLVDALDLTTIQGIRDRALLLIGFDSALRRSELVSITLDNIERQDKGLLIYIPYSKTDQSGKGTHVAVLRRENSSCCPVSALDNWLTVASIESGHVFRRIFKNRKIGASPLSDRSVSLIIKRSAKTAGYTKREIAGFSGHSLRRGFITSAAYDGKDLVSIMKQTNHKKITSLTGYIESRDLLKNHPGHDLLR